MADRCALAFNQIELDLPGPFRARYRLEFRPLKRELTVIVDHGVWARYLPDEALDAALAFEADTTQEVEELERDRAEEHEKVAANRHETLRYLSLSASECRFEKACRDPSTCRNMHSRDLRCTQCALTMSSQALLGTQNDRGRFTKWVPLPPPSVAGVFPTLSP